MAQYNYQKTDGALQFGHVDANNFLIKLDTKLSDNWKLTLFGTTGYEYYNSVKSVTFSQLKTFGRQYGEVNGNPKSQDYVGDNNSEKRTDMIYADLQGKLGYGITISNKAYTYAYDYPVLQNNGNDQSIFASAALIQATITNGANNGLAYQNTPNSTYAGGPVFDNGTFFGSFLYKAVGAQYGGAGQLASSAAANAALNKVGSYSSSDAVAGVRVDAKKWFGFGEKAEIKFGVQNIFDNHSIVDIGGTPGAKQLSDADPASKLSYTSQAGRFMYMGAKVNF